jgi:hypothetical protein
MPIQFASTQSVKLAVPEQPISIHHYLRQPQRLISSLVDPSRTEQLSADVFRLKMRPLKFMTLSIQPTVDMKFWAESNSTVHLESLGCKIHGVDYIDQRFSLSLVGQLAPHEHDGKTVLVGQADLTVQVELPPPFRITPRPLLEATGNGLLRSVLLTIKQRLMHQLLADYRKWVTAQLRADEGSSSEADLLSPNSQVS